MFIIFELNIEGLDILHISDDISSVENYFTDVANPSFVNDFSVKTLLESNGLYFHDRKCAIDMNYDNSKYDEKWRSKFTYMYKLIKPYERDIKLNKIIP